MSSERIQYEVVEKGSAGVLGGLFGSKPAVDVYKRQLNIRKIGEFLSILAQNFEYRVLTGDHSIEFFIRFDGYKGI